MKQLSKAFVAISDVPQSSGGESLGIAVAVAVRLINDGGMVGNRRNGIGFLIRTFYNHKPSKHKTLTKHSDFIVTALSPIGGTVNVTDICTNHID